MSEGCEIPLRNATSEEIRHLLMTARRIAVVGHSDNPARDSHRIGRYLVGAGYEVFAVNPGARSTPGLHFYPDLASVPPPIDIVDIFRRREFIETIVDEAIHAGAKAVWMQEGLAHNTAAEKARAAGLLVVMNTCIMKAHRAIVH